MVIFGEDLNWGWIISMIGVIDVDIDVVMVDIEMNGVLFV